MRRTSLLAGLAAAALALGACNGTDEAVPDDDQPPAAQDETDEEDADEGDDGGSDGMYGNGGDDDADDEGTDDGPAALGVADTDLGTILVDADGMSLYMFDPDEQGESTCYDDCAEAWPPLVVDDDDVTGEGVDESLVGTVERDDGATQVTYNDWPLYLWVDDEAPGDVTGQGVNDVWWVITPEGEPVRD